jgi:hypothetical protein
MRHFVKFVVHLVVEQAPLQVFRFVKLGAQLAAV